MRVALTGSGPLESELRAIIPRTIEIVSGDAEVLISGVPEEADLDDRTSLRAVVIPYAGVPKTTRERVAARPPLALHNLHHNAIPTAELAFALLLAACKRIVPLDQKLRRADWSARFTQSDVPLLFGSRALIVGYGAIGKHLETICNGFGMKTRVIRRTGFTDAALDAALLEADALLVAVPWTPETEGMFGAARLAMLPHGATIVNVARGPVFNEDALFAELLSGRLNAGLDVWYQYPKQDGERANTAPSKHDFGSLDNVTLSPHRAGHCEGIDAVRAKHLLRLLCAEPMLNRVDLSVGY